MGKLLKNREKIALAISSIRAGGVSLQFLLLY